METILTRGPRCAIYTRKSAQPPVAQEITSLEAQRAICAAYIASQQHKQWVELVDHYDDSGRSGSNLDRPALQLLMTDIELGRVDVVLVYKLDRISRTLLDFVRLIDFFERYGVIFVCITQNFDTSDSMGRLIRNILLTFAQFEREIATDRMRDKKRVMAQRGIWTGGEAPLGYDLRRGKLLINEREAAAVRQIFETYLRDQRLLAVEKKLGELSFRRKVWRTKAGQIRGGGPVQSATIRHILGNPIYIGEIRSMGENYRGLHDPIVDRSVWERAQVILAERTEYKLQCQPNLLSGLVVDGYGRTMNNRFGNNEHAPYRYYASQRKTWAMRQGVKPVRANAEQLEKLVLEAVRKLLADRIELRLLLMNARVLDSDLQRLVSRGNALSVLLQRLSSRQLATVFRGILERVEVQLDFVRIILRLNVVPLLLQWDGVGLFAVDAVTQVRASNLHVIDIVAAVARQRKRHVLPISHRDGNIGTIDPKLVRLIAEARAAQMLVFDNRDTPLKTLAESVGRKASSFCRLVRLNYLAPDIIAAMLDGQQPENLTYKVLMQADLPIDWNLQRRLLGFRPGNDHMPSIAHEARARH